MHSSYALQTVAANVNFDATVRSPHVRVRCGQMLAKDSLPIRSLAKTMLHSRITPPKFKAVKLLNSGKTAVIGFSGQFPAK